MSVPGRPRTAGPSLASVAVPVPLLVAGRPPLAILVDYDRTIALTDVSDAHLAPFVTAEWDDRVAEYDAGLVGTRRLMEWEVGLITADAARLLATAAASPTTLTPPAARRSHRRRACQIPTATRGCRHASCPRGSHPIRRLMGTTRPRGWPGNRTRPASTGGAGL